MNMLSIEQELKSNAYPGRGIILGKSRMGKRQLPHILLWDAVRTAETGCL